MLTRAVLRRASLFGTLLVVTACGASTPSPSTQAAGTAAVGAASAGPSSGSGPTTSPAAVVTAPVTYKGNAGRTGEIAGVLPAGDVTTLWTMASGGPMKSSPVTDGSAAIVVSGDGHVVALDPATGERRWSTADGGYVGNPAVTPSFVLVGDDRGNVVALSVATGAEAWRAPGAVDDLASPVVVGDTVIVTGTDRSVHALVAATGAPRWSAGAGGDLPRAVAIDAGRVFVGATDGFVYGFDGGDGSLAWSYRTSNGGFATLAARDGTVYAAGGTGGNDGRMFALDAATGQLRWQVDAPDGHGFRSPSVDSDTVYIGTSGGPVLALATADGSERWRFSTSSAEEGAIAIAGSAILFMGNDLSLYALDRGDGHVLWKADLGVAADGSPTVIDGHVLVSTTDGTLVALGSAPVAAGASPSATPAAPETLDPIGELSAPGGLDVPVDVSLGPKGEIWVTEGGADRFAIFEPDGTFRERWGTPGTGNGQLDFTTPDESDPTGSIAWAKDGSFYVSDSGNYRVQHFDKHRKWLGSFGLFGSGDGQFLGATQLALDDHGNVYVSDRVRGDLQAFNASGRLLGVVGERGAGDGKLTGPEAPLVVGKRLYVVDGTDHWTELEVLDLDGRPIGTVHSPELLNIQGPVLGPKGLIYVAEWEGGVHVVDPTTLKVVASWKVGGGYPASTVEGLAVAPDGRIFAAEWTFNKVEVFKPPVP